MENDPMPTARFGTIMNLSEKLRKTGQNVSKGCMTYASQDQAEAAITALNKATIPGDTAPEEAHSRPFCQLEFPDRHRYRVA
jgi:hypothetical protein